jgi:DNA-binding MurR/RpiR family transcriptional regulator
MPPDNAVNRITDAYYRLTASEKKLANFVVANGVKAQRMSISEIAQECGVAGATVSRFCRRLGYSGFSSFRLALAGNTDRAPANPLAGEIQPEDSVLEVCDKVAGANIDAIHETRKLVCEKDIQTAADAVLAADKVICMGQGGSMLMAQETAHLFSTAFSNFFPVIDSHMQAITVSQLTQRDLILYFSYSGSTRELLELLRIARKRGVRSLLITRYPNSPGAALADLVLQCGSMEGPLQLGSVAARMAQLYLMDVLFSEVCRRDLEGCRARREGVADALAEKHL